MRHSSLLVTVFAILCGGHNLLSQGGNRKPPVELTRAAIESREVLYKRTPQGDLKLHFYLPPRSEAGTPLRKPCVVFFFGGGWKSGTYLQFVPQARYLAGRGLITACADYRILSQHQTLPDKAVEDAKSAIRWLRGHADEWGIDPARIIAAGGSAGGHLAACTAFVTAYDAPGESSLSCKPDALVLFNPAMNIATLVKERAASSGPDLPLEMAEAITPNRFVTKQAPPALFFFGSADKLKLGADEYMRMARDLGLRAEMWTAKDQPHGFFNREPWLQQTTRQMDLFLISLGYLRGQPSLIIPEDAPPLVKE